MMAIVLATCAALPELDSDDQRLYHALKAAGIPVEIAIWDDSTVDWSRYAMCVIRSTWDYVPRREQYVRWAEQVAAQTALWNPAPLIRWNTDKNYLRQMESQGIPVVETAWLAQGSLIDFGALFQSKGWDEVVVKPVISASGKDTFRVNAQTLSALNDELQALLTQRALIVQPFMRSVATVGELSFLFFNGQFSHGVRKKPAAGEFRVQEHLGGILQVFHPTAEQRALAEAVIGRIPGPSLYARVDFMVDDQGNLRLSELELTEPSMYLGHDTKAVQRFVQAIQDRLTEISQ